MMSKSLILVVLASVVGMVRGGGSCRAARKCCDGKDTDCAVQNSALDNLIMSLEDEPCYCDHGCLDMGDCCSDFKEFCGVMDCQVSSWTAWSACDATCGTGKSTRTRTVLQPESNGGVSCPDLSQSRACRGQQCVRRSSSRRHKATSSALRETGMLLPGKYSQLDKEEEDRYEVRENLKSWVEDDNTDQYCVVFKVTKAMKSCSKHEETEKLQQGQEVCVSCESKASRPHLGDRCSGHGVDNKATRFKNVITPHCHGRWTRVEVTDRCPCPGGPDFIFV